MLIYLTLIEEPKFKSLFEQIYYDYRASMFYISNNILRDVHWAEDAVSESFLLIARNISKISTLSCNKQRNYIVILTRNAALSLYRKRKQQEVPIDFLEEASDSYIIEDAVISTESYENLINVIEALETEYCDILKLYYLYEHTTAEISKILGIGQGAVRTRLFRARSKLAAALQAKGDALK